MKKILILALIAIFLCSYTTLAEENETNSTIELTVNESIPEEEIEPPVIDFELMNITPKQAEKGDILLKLRVKNSGNVDVTNLVPIIVAKGFSTYDSIPIKILRSNETGIMTISGEFKEEGNILLTIKINEKIFYDSIEIKSTPITTVDEGAQEQLLQNLTEKVKELKGQYEELEIEYREKRKKYDVTEIKLDNLKTYIMDAETFLGSKNTESAKMKIIQARTEYEDQKDKLENVLKKPYFTKIRDNILVFSAIAGAIITLTTFYEIMRKKQAALYEKIKDVEILKEKPTKGKKKK